MAVSLDYHPELAGAFRYGVLSSRVASALQEYLSASELSAEAAGAVEDAQDLVWSIVSAQQALGRERVDAAPPHNAWDAFELALQVVQARQKEFGVRDARDVATLFSRIQRTLEGLQKQGESAAPVAEDLKTSLAFFRELAALLLAQLSSAPAPVLSLL